MDQNVECELA